MSNPDFSLISPLTKLLHVSADELLGLASENNDDQRKEIESQYRETWKTDDLAQRYTVVCTAVSKYPGEMQYLDWLAWCEGMRSFALSDDRGCFADQEKAIKHFTCVIENAQDEKIKASSIKGIVSIYVSEADMMKQNICRVIPRKLFCKQRRHFAGLPSGQRKNSSLSKDARPHVDGYSKPYRKSRYVSL